MSHNHHSIHDCYEAANFKHTGKRLIDQATGHRLVEGECQTCGRASYEVYDRTTGEFIDLWTASNEPTIPN